MSPYSETVPVVTPPDIRLDNYVRVADQPEGRQPSQYRGACRDESVGKRSADGSQVVGEPPMCVDAPSMQWFADAKSHKPRPTNTVPGITYMLAGGTQRSDSDPHDAMSPPITVGPHWMIM